MIFSFIPIFNIKRKKELKKVETFNQILQVVTILLFNFEYIKVYS